MSDECMTRPIPGFTEYEVSDCGGVRRRVRAKGSRCRWLRPWIRPKASGHLSVALSVGGKVTVITVHRLVALAFIGPPPSAKHEVAHWDGHPRHNHVSNLRWATHLENSADALRHGTRARGTRNGIAKLDDSRIVEIRRRSAAGENSYTIARHVGVHSRTVRNVLCGDTWRHVEGA